MTERLMRSRSAVTVMAVRKVTVAKRKWAAMGWNRILLFIAWVRGVHCYLYHGFCKNHCTPRNEGYNGILHNPGTNKMYTEKPCYECFVTKLREKNQDMLSTPARCHATNDTGKEVQNKTCIEFRWVFSHRVNFRRHYDWLCIVLNE